MEKQVEEIAYSVRYKEIPTGLLGQCIQFPSLIIKAKNFKELQVEMEDAVKMFLSVHPEKISLVSKRQIGQSNNVLSRQAPKQPWQERRLESAITVRR